jgi:hypothetical protein
MSELDEKLSSREIDQAVHDRNATHISCHRLTAVGIYLKQPKEVPFHPTPFFGARSSYHVWRVVATWLVWRSAETHAAVLLRPG